MKRVRKSYFVIGGLVFLVLSFALIVGFSKGEQDVRTNAAGSTTLNVTVLLHGLGNGGDSGSQTVKGNFNLKRPTRVITIDIYNAQNQLVTTKQTEVRFGAATGKFTGTAAIGIVPAGSYTIKIKADQYLRAQVPGIQNLAGGTVNIPEVAMVTGDVNNDNQLNISDFNLLIGCYSDLSPAISCNATNKLKTDLTDEGDVNQYDYNLLLKEIANRTGEPNAAPTNVPTPTKTAAGVSGEAMPVGDLTNWKQVMADDFLGTALGSGWGKYSGDIPSMPGGVWDPKRVEVANGALRLLAANRGDGVWTSGGVANTGAAKRTYGKWVMRMRIDKANGVKYAGLLWPSNGTWPVDGEIDFAEDGGGARTGTSATTHYAGPDGKGHYIVQKSLSIDMSKWQTIGVEWTPGKIVYTINGKPWAEVTSPAAAIPDGPMFFALQTEANTRGATQWMTTVDATTPKLVVCEVDWLVVYTPR